MAIWNIRGWDHLKGSNHGVIAAREEILHLLGDVPEPHMSNWKKRLTSKLDHSHFSTRLEIYLHHFFKERGWGIEIEPDLPDTTHKPDFRLRRDDSEILVEAKSLVDSKPVEQQDTRLMSLADRLSRKLSRTVSIHPLIDLPPNLPYKGIASDIEAKASDAELAQEFIVEGEHEGYPYELEVTVIIEDKPTPSSGVGVTVGQAQDMNAGLRMRKAIIQKAGKYGKPDIPLVIMVWPQTSLYNSGPKNDDRIALAGDDDWPNDFPKPNGVFTLKRNDGTAHYSRVSAVGIYKFSYNYDNSHNHSLRVYHNPFADHPLDDSVFQGVPQARVDLATGELTWTDNDCPVESTKVSYSSAEWTISVHHPSGGGSIFHKRNCAITQEGLPDSSQDWAIWNTEEEAIEHSEPPIVRCKFCL